MANNQQPPNPLSKKVARDDLFDELYPEDGVKKDQTKSKQKPSETKKKQDSEVKSDSYKDREEIKSIQISDKKRKTGKKTYKQFYLSLETRVIFEDILANARRYVLLKHEKSLGDSHLIELMINAFHEKIYTNEDEFHKLIDETMKTT